MNEGIKYSEFRKLFFNPRVNKKQLIHNIKHSVSDLDNLLKFEKQYRSGLKSATTLFNNALYGQNPLPKSYDYLNKNDPSHFTNSFKSEFNWLVKGLVDFSDEINLFIELQQIFEDELFKGNYKEARVILNQIESNLCVSFWGIENRFILDEYELGTEENWNSRKLFLKEGVEPFVQAFSNIFSVRAEKNISFFHFNIEIDKWLHVQGILDNDELFGLNEYLRFKGNFFSFSNYTQYPFFIFKESGGSVIDKYLMFKRICSHLLLDTNYKSQILKGLNYVSTEIKDPVLRNLLTYDSSVEPLDLFPADNDFLRIVDLYTIGQYSDVVVEVKKFFNEYKTGELHIIELYVKSICELNLEYENLCSVPSIMDVIGSAMHRVLMKTNETEDSLITLVNYSYLFSNSRHGVFIYNFVSNQLGWDNQLNYSFLLSSNSSVLNPIMLASTNGKSDNYHLRIKGARDSFAIKLIKKEFNLNAIDADHLDKIPEQKRELYKARFLMNSELYDDAKKIYLELISASSLSIIALYELYSSLYYCHLRKEEYREAIKLFVKVNADNPNLTKQMNYDELLKGVIIGKFKNVGDKSSLIELPIFFRINSKDRIRIKQSLEVFLKSVKCTKPTEFIDQVDDFSRNDVLYFFRNVCAVEILQLSKAFKSSFQVNEERIGVCKFLAEYDSDRASLYKEEIADLTQKNTISRVIAKIDERKIYVNEEKLYKAFYKVQKQNVFHNESLSPLNQESFDRYVKLNKYIKENNEYRNISPVSFNDDGEVQVTNESFLDSYDVIFYYPAFQIFSTFFLYIRDLFVFNKENGLDTYLSTKIRHGTLPNHLRSVFESNQLVTTQSNSEYVENKYWTEKLITISNKNEKVQEYLSEFSMNIDNYSKQIKDEFIQCKSESEITHANAEFDYSYTEQDQIELYIKKFHDVYVIDDFIELVFNELWNRTEFIMENVRHKFNNEYRDHFLRLLSHLESNLTSSFQKNEINELLSQIMTCRTDIQHKLNNISQWFRRSESTYEGDYKVDVLAQTSVEITKNIHPNYSFTIDTELESKATVKGEYHEHFIDLVNNCLFNMIEHSHLDSVHLNAQLKIYEEEGELILIFSNNVDNSEEHISKLSEIKGKWGALDSNISQERGTGFPKVKKIISSDLNRQNSYFNFNIEDRKIDIELKFELKDL